MRRLGKAVERASERARMVLAKVYSPRVAKGAKQEGWRALAHHPREKLNTGLILPAIQPLILPSFSPGFILFRAPLFCRAIRSVQTNERPFFLSFPLIAESETRATVIPFLARLSLFLPSLTFVAFISVCLCLFSLHGASSYSFSFIGTAFINIQWPATSPATAKLLDFACVEYFAPLNWIWLKSMFH